MDDSSIRFIRTWLGTHSHNDDTPIDGDGRYADQPVIAEQDDTQPDTLLEDIAVQGSTASPATTRTSERVLPSRLLDLSRWGSRTPHVRVVLQSTFTRSNLVVRYAALSYCWRADETVMLRGNSPDLSISRMELSPTIRNAADIAQRLNASYLWVDALCIKQDADSADKDEELQKMQDIYNNAEFVIAAAAASDSSESFIVQQNPYAYTPCVVGVAGQLRQLTNNKSRTFGAIYALPSRKYASEALSDLEFSRLTSRGWVFQEERLARKLIYFADHQVVLQCNLCDQRVKQLDWEQCATWQHAPIPDLVRPDILATFYKLMLSPFVKNIVQWTAAHNASSKAAENRKVRLHPSIKLDKVLSATINGESDYPGGFANLLNGNLESLAQEVWWSLVESYSRRFVSHKSDRAPAIQGLANRVQREIYAKDKQGEIPVYIYGMFVSTYTLPASLLWYVSDGRVSRPDYRAPSWSWISVEGSIKNNSRAGEHHKSKVEVWGDPIGTRILHFRACVRIAFWRTMKEDRRYYVGHHAKLPRSDYRYHAQFIPIVSDPTAGPEALALFCDEYHHQVGYFIPDTIDDLPYNADESLDPSVASLATQIYCMQIDVIPRNEKDFAQPRATRGLALIKADADEEVYRRVGYIELMQDHEGMAVSKTWPNKARNRDGRTTGKKGSLSTDKYGFFNQRPRIIALV